MTGFIKEQPSLKKKDTAFLTMSADQATGLAVDSPIQFNQCVGSLNLSNYKVTLKAGKKYKLVGDALIVMSSGSSRVSLQWYDVTNGAYIGVESYVVPATYPNNATQKPSTEAVITPNADIEVELRISSTTGSAYRVTAESSSAYIESVESYDVVTTENIYPVDGNNTVVKTKYLTGTTDSDATTLINHGISDWTKILNVNGFIRQATNAYVKEVYEGSSTANNAYDIRLKPTTISFESVQSANQGRPYKIKIDYME